MSRMKTDESTDNRRKWQEEAEKLRLLQELKGKENVTLDGHKINIYANIGSVGDIGYVMENDAGGIGLFRSEFLYLGRNDFPTEEEQFQAYKQAVQMMAGKKVIIRTLDIGADKQVDYFNLGNEDNPAMGYRAIRICLKTAGNLQNTASCTSPCSRLWKSFYHVSDDHFYRGSKENL